MDGYGCLASLVIGALAGWLAGFFVRKDKQGCLWNMLIGLVGGFIGGNIFSWLGISWGGLLGTIGTAVVGAVILLWVWNKLRD